MNNESGATPRVNSVVVAIAVLAVIEAALIAWVIHRTLTR